MAADAVAEIKARLDIVDVIGSSVSLRKAGREYAGLCPFHNEKTPSFMVSREKQVWKCHGCDEGGDLIHFVMLTEHADFRQALESLAERAGIELESRGGSAGRSGAGRRRRRAIEVNSRAQMYFEHVLWNHPQGEPGRRLLAARGVTREAVSQFAVGFAPAGGGSEDSLTRYLLKWGATVDEIADAGLAHRSRDGRPRDRFRHRLMFPIRDERGQTVAFGGRALGDAMPKYLNSPETPAYIKSRTLFGLDLARGAMMATRMAVVVEGYFDVIAAHRVGVAAAVASSGTALTRDQVRTLHRHADTIVLCFDGDAAGQAASSRAVDLVAAEGCSARICVLPAGVKDPDDLARQDPAALAAAIESAPPEWQVLLDRALGDDGRGDPDSRRAAAERAVQLLLRIPEASVREIYLQEAARRLDISSDSLASDVARGLRQPHRRTPVLAVPAPPLAEVPAAVQADEASDPPPSSWERLIAALAVHRPALAHTLGAAGLVADDLASPRVRRLLEVAAAAAEEGDTFPVHLLSRGDQRLAAELLMEPLPVLDDSAALEDLGRAVGEAVLKVRIAALQRQAEVARREMRRAVLEGRSGDDLAATVTVLAAEIERLRRTPGP